MKMFSKMFLVLINLIIIFNVKSCVSQVHEQNITGCNFCNDSEVNKSNYNSYKVAEINMKNQQLQFAPIFDETIIKSTSIGYGVILLAKDYILSNSCYTEMLHLYESMQRKETWAIKGN